MITNLKLLPKSEFANNRLIEKEIWTRKSVKLKKNWFNFFFNFLEFKKKIEMVLRVGGRGNKGTIRMSNLDEISDEAKENFKNFLNEYSFGGNKSLIEEWFEYHFEDEVKQGLNDERDGWEVFRNFAFNDSDESDNDFWKFTGSEKLNELFCVGDVMEMMVACSDDFNDSFDVQLKMTDKNFNSERRIWNTLAYWATYTDLTDDIREEFKKRWDEKVAGEVEENPNTTCDICYENKQIHACCASCKGKLLCKSCYTKLDNECPFCRRMILFDSKMFRPFVKLEEAEKKYRSLIWVRSESKEEWLNKLADVCKEIKGEVL